MIRTSIIAFVLLFTISAFAMDKKECISILKADRDNKIELIKNIGKEEWNNPDWKNYYAHIMKKINAYEYAIEKLKE